MEPSRDPLDNASPELVEFVSTHYTEITALLSVYEYRPNSFGFDWTRRPSAESLLPPTRGQMDALLRKAERLIKLLTPATPRLGSGGPPESHRTPERS